MRNVHWCDFWGRRCGAGSVTYPYERIPQKGLRNCTEFCISIVLHFPSSYVFFGKWWGELLVEASLATSRYFSFRRSCKVLLDVVASTIIKLIINERSAKSVAEGFVYLQYGTKPRTRLIPQFRRRILSLKWVNRSPVREKGALSSTGIQREPSLTSFLLGKNQAK